MDSTSYQARQSAPVRMDPRSDSNWTCHEIPLTQYSDVIVPSMPHFQEVGMTQEISRSDGNERFLPKSGMEIILEGREYRRVRVQRTNASWSSST